MRLTMKVGVLFFLITIACQHALAVGYEQESPPLLPQSVQRSLQGQPQASLLDAIKEATFADRCVSYLDQAALFVKDLLDQFGLKPNQEK